MEQITREIYKFIERVQMSPYEINNGFCDDLAREIEEKVPGAEAEDHGLHNTLGGHVWIKYNGRYYDAETPEGVDNINHFPVFKRRKL